MVLSQLQLFHNDFLMRVVVAWWRSGRPPIQLSSGFRSRDENAAVFGAEDSQHQLGLAFDFVGPTQRFAEEARRWSLTVVDEGDHVHLQYFRAGVARQLGLFIDV